jgi:hypothetical protein
MMHAMRCERFEELLPDLMEGSLDEEQRAATDEHMAACADCRALVSDLHRIVTAAGSLPVIEPASDLWPGIADRLSLRSHARLSLNGRRAGGRPSSAADRLAPPLGAPRFPRWRAQLAAAATVLLAVTGGVLATRGGSVDSPALPDASSDVAFSPSDAAGEEVSAPREAAASGDASGSRAGAGQAGQLPSGAGAQPRPSGAVPGGAPSALASAGGASSPAGASRAQGNAGAAQQSSGTTVQASASPGSAQLLAQSYAAEIEALAAILETNRGVLDSSTVAVLQRNLAVIDAAIQESRRALEEDPASELLVDQLNTVFDMKLEMLRRAVILSSGA